MLENLLQTKLFIPSRRKNLVPRPRLFDRLNKGLDENCKLTLISAPAGFGKTTLLTEWRHRIPDSVDLHALCQNPYFGWLSLDAGDNDPILFTSYLLAALRRIITGVGETAIAWLRSPTPPPASKIIAQILNEITTLAEGGDLTHCCYMLILDDYHLIEAQSIHDSLRFIIDNLPPPLHLAISSRADLPWSIARLRAGDQITELRSTDLRFTLEETTDFLTRIMGIDSSEDELLALEERTEGWIAGLQLAALSMRTLDERARAEFVSDFTGSSRYILDYLIDEVLNRRPRGTKEFLLQTSILARMNGSLCDALLHPFSGEKITSGSQTILERLERANLFVVPLDDRRQWYRYHHLFGDLLRVRLNQTYPNRLPTLHRRAADWYKAHGHVDEAIHHALEAGAQGEAVRLILREAPRALDDSELSKLTGWIGSLPEPVVVNNPWLCIYHAWALRLTGVPYSLVESRLKDAEKAIAHHSPPALEEGRGKNEPSKMDTEDMLGHIASIRAFQALYREDISTANKLALQAEHNIAQESFIRPSTLWALAWSYRLSGDLVKSSLTFRQSREIALKNNNTYVAVTSTARLAHDRVLAGKLNKAAKCCRSALEIASLSDGRRLPVAGYPLVYLGGIEREWNDLDSAERNLLDGIELCSLVGYMMDQIVGYAYLARVHLARRDLPKARVALEEGKKISQKMVGYGYAKRWVEDYQIRLWQYELDFQGNPIESQIARWIEETDMKVTDQPTFRRELEHLILARALVVLGRETNQGAIVANGLAILDKLLEAAKSAGWEGKVIEIQTLRALAFHARNEIQWALDALEQALIAAGRKGYTRMFLDEGKPMAALLYQAMTNGIAPEYCGRLLAQFHSEQEGATQFTTDKPAPFILEPLTKRELEVIRLLGEGTSNAEIATRLFITVGTVKNHLKNIYGKLNVHNRTQAVARARELDLIE